MKIDRSRLKKSASEVPSECQTLIEKLRSCSDRELLKELKKIDAWTFGKSELYHWIDILDIFDCILEAGCRRIATDNWILYCDLPEHRQDRELLLQVLNFSTLLIEHSFSRHLYNSMEHLIALLASCDMNIVLAVLSLLYMFSKRSNFITRLNTEKRTALIRRLTYLAESWGGQESGYSLSDCCLNMPMSEYPPGSSILHYEYYAEVSEKNPFKSVKNKTSNMLTVIHIENLDKLNKSPAEIMNDLVKEYPPPKDPEILMMLFTHIRLAVNFPNYPVRLLCVQARLQALSVLAYSSALGDNAHSLLYNGLLEELVEVVEHADKDLVEIRAAALRTLTSIIHLDRNPHFPKKSGSRLNMIIDVTGASSYHGFLPTLVRSCINSLMAPDKNRNNVSAPFHLSLATALFSFLYHLASYEAGGEALVNCGMMESLLRVINWPGREIEHITFVTRAVRVIDLITNIDMQGFQTHGGISSFINRLEVEVDICRKEQPFEIQVNPSSHLSEGTQTDSGPSGTSDTDTAESRSGTRAETSALARANALALARGEDLALTRAEVYALHRAEMSTRVAEARAEAAAEALAVAEQEYIAGASALARAEASARVAEARAEAAAEALAEALVEATGEASAEEIAEATAALAETRAALAESRGGVAESRGDVAETTSDSSSETTAGTSPGTGARTAQVVADPAAEECTTLDDSDDIGNDEEAELDVTGVEDAPEDNTSTSRGFRGSSTEEEVRYRISLFERLRGRVIQFEQLREREERNDTGDSEEMDVEVGPSQESDANTTSTYTASISSENSVIRILKLQDYSAAKTGKMCLPQRAALLKSMLNFLKKAIQDSNFSDSIRHIMDGSLPNSLKHIISNAEYYGPSLFLLATDVVTVYVFQEPSLLSSLQDNGLTQVVLGALLVKDVPATREVLGSLPNVFSALCLNDRGLQMFVQSQPFESLFKVLLSPVYLGAMRRRRSSDPTGDTATNLGNAMDELMRHQPTLKTSATRAIIKLLEELCGLGRDPKYICWRAQSKMDVSPTPAPRPASNTDGGSSDEEEEDEEEASTSSHTQRDDSATDSTNLSERTPIALIDYILNVMKFVDAILSNNSTDDHCREFVAQNGLHPLMSILGLPNLPVDYPGTAATQAVATVCKSILNLSHEPQVLKIGLMQLSVVLDSLKPLHCPVEDPGSSVLLHELASAPNLESAFSTASATPLLHAMSAAHGYVVMFVHVCRTGQTDIRFLSISHWASELGLSVLRGLCKLYSSLVWESTLLLALCSDDIIPADSKFGKEDMDKLLPSDFRGEGDTQWSVGSNDLNSNGMTSAMEALSTNDMEVEPEGSGRKVKEGMRPLPTNVQLKYIRPLLGASSRLGRALAELFGLLVKLCVGSPMRQRRGQQITSSTPLLPSPPARAVAGALTELLVDGLTWKNLPDTPITKFKLTYLICSVGFTSPMLCDEKKFPYHLMLQKFVQLNGLAAFFETFHWAITGGYRWAPEEGLEHPDLPEGAGEFLDAWLVLLEKLVNPKTVLESPHNITVKHGIIYKAFDPLKYLLDIQKSAFDAVMLLWDKKPLKLYGPRMTDSMLVILRHILRGERILMERLSKEKEASVQTGENGSNGPGPSSASNSTPEPSSSSSNPPRRRVDLDTPEPDVNVEVLTQLMDMGFSRNHCVEALLHSSSVEQATEFLLSNPSPPNRPAQNLSMDFDLAEEDQMLRAIAMSLGEKILADCDRKEALKQKKAKEDYDVLLSRKAVIDQFTSTVLKACLNLLDSIPDSVFRICELLAVVSKRNGKAWWTEMLNDLIVDIGNKAHYLLDVMDSGLSPEDVVSEIVNSDAAVKAAGRIHLFTLLFEPCLQGPTQQEVRLSCAMCVEQTHAMEAFCQLVMQGQEALTAYGKAVTPPWLAPLLLLIDLLEKVALTTHRRYAMLKVTYGVWRWFDLTSGKWTPYSVANNKIINDAFWNGEIAVRLSCGRRRYIINFNYMSQANEESGSRRPVIMSLVCRERTEGKDYPPKSEKKDDKESEKMDVDQNGSDDREKRNCWRSSPLDKEDAEMLVRACCGLISLPVDIHALHAAMRLCLRLSRDYDNARAFVKHGGVKLLLNLTQASGFAGFSNLATLLIRHAIEEPVTLRHAMEKVIRARTLANIPPPYKEVLYLMRNTSSCVCRDPDAYSEVAQDILRVDLNLLPKRNDDDDPRLLVKCQPSRWNTSFVMQEEAALQVISDLLNALIRPIVEDNAPSSSESEEREKLPPPKRMLTTHSSSAVIHNTLMHRHPGDPLHPDAIEQREQGEVTSNSKKLRDDYLLHSSKLSDNDKNRPLLAKSDILKILAEAVRSYTACAKLITDHAYPAGMSDLLPEECSALAFILDKLLHISENQYDSNCHAMSRMLIAAIASCNHCLEAQTVLVCEVKAALQRSFAMPESMEKHTHIQNLAGIVSSMIDNCPPVISPPSAAANKMHQFPNNVNNVVKVMLRKGILTDLARVSHYLDLSSPNIASSINAALKPLETLSRIVNLPSTSQPSKTGKTKPQVHREGSAEQTGTTTSEATHAQGEEAVEDPENTEHDISGTAESLEQMSESQAERNVDAVLSDVMEQLLDGPENTEHDISGAPESLEQMSESQVERTVDAVLNDVMEQLLDGDNVSNDDNMLSRGFAVEPEAQTNRMETDEILVAQVRGVGNDDDTQDVERVQSSDSDSGSNPSDEADEVNNVGDEEDDDDDDDDDGDNEDDEEISSAFGEEALSFFDAAEDGLFHLPGLERESEDILMIQYSDPDLPGPGPHHASWNSNPFPIPISLLEDPAAASDAGGLNPLTPSHPLLTVRPLDNTAAPRSRTNNRGRRYQYLQLNGRNANPPVILQRLLGPGNHDLSITTNQAGFRDATRVVVMDNGMGLFTNANSEEEPIDYVVSDTELPGEDMFLLVRDLFNSNISTTQDQSGYLFGPSLTATLSSVPTALWWWSEEGKLLDGDSQPDCVLSTAARVIEFLETHKAEETAYRRERMKRRLEEEREKRRKDKKQSPAEDGSNSAGTSQTPGPPCSSAGNSDVASVTESLAESIVESVLRPSLQNQPPTADGPDFSELTTGLLSSLSEILPSVSSQQNSLQRYPESEPVHSESSVPNSMMGSDETSQRPSSGPSELVTLHSAADSEEFGDVTSQCSRIPLPYPEQCSTTELIPVSGALALGAPLIALSGEQSSHGMLQFSTLEPVINAQSNEELRLAPDENNILETSEEYNCLEELYDDSHPPPLLPLDDVREYTPPPPLISLEEFRSRSQNPQSAAGGPSNALPSPSTPTTNVSTYADTLAGESRNQEIMDHCVNDGNIFDDVDPQPAATGLSENVTEYENESDASVSWQTTPQEAEAAAAAIIPPVNLQDLQEGTSAESSTIDTGDVENGDELPEGVDPSFLAALPDEMREEVIAEQLRLQRLRQRALQQSSDAPANVTEVSPEFLAALPPAIQEEVLAQQRMEQQRQAAAAANPNDPVDAAAFFQNLQPSLRQAILTDMEDSQISVLPPDLAQEAQNLRREWEARNRQMMQERFFSHVSHSNSALSSILRNSGRVGSARYAIHAVPQRGSQWNPWSTRPDPQQPSSAATQGLKLRGRQLLDYEALACLLVVLFIDEPKLNTSRLHRVFRNLSYHGPTREWIVKALLSIMEHCSDCRPEGTPVHRPKRMSTRSQALLSQNSSSSTPSCSTPSWLNISMDAALGLRAGVFNIVRHSGKRASRSQETSAITIHAQAAPIVFRHTLEVLISLAKAFPSFFLPVKNKEAEKEPSKDDSGSTSRVRASTSGTQSSPRGSRNDSTNFWDILLKLDSASSSKKGKSVARSHFLPGPMTEEEHFAHSFESSTFGQLITLLGSPVVKRSSMLTDKLLRLLSLVSVALPDVNPYLRRREQPEGKRPEEKEESVPVAEQHLKLAVDVLTSKSCSEEGLEDATALLLNLATCPDPTKDIILRLLLDGAMELANSVNRCIFALMKELKQMNRQLHRDDHEDSSITDRPNKGVVPDRFTNDTVVVTAPVKVKTGCDLQLPSMGNLTTKTSSQAFFLRILKVIIQIRETVRLSHRRRRSNSETVDKPKTDDLVLPPLSEQLPLDHLWETLSDCLLELAETPDHHAVLVLQPAVEAFFLVHSTASEEQRFNHEVRIEPSVRINERVRAANGSGDASGPSQPALSANASSTSGVGGGGGDASGEAPVSAGTSGTLATITITDTATGITTTRTINTAIDTSSSATTTAASTNTPGSDIVAQLGSGTTASADGAAIQPNVAPVSPLQPDSDSVGTVADPSTSFMGFGWEPTPSPVMLPPDQQKFLKFAETHRTVLNQILRQSTTHLADGPFAVLVDHTRVLDFDVKRRYFRSELERMDEGLRREELAVHVRRSHVFEDSFRELHRRSADEWKNRFYIVFEGEEGQDAGGLLREWYVIISREIFNPMYALFTTSPGDRVTYMINSSSHCNPNHLCYFKFVGRVIAKAIYDNKLLECYFTRSFYKHILGIHVKHTDMESEDYSFYQGLVYLMEHDVSDLGYDLTFSAEVQEFGVTDIRDLIPNGRNIPVSEHNKMDYIRLVCQMKMTGAIRKQINAFLEGFYDIIPKRLISIFNEQELELLISGMPNVDIEDLKANTEYHKYQTNSLQIQWFWRALRGFDQADRAKFLQFVTGTSKVPLQGFAALEGMNGVQKFQIHRDDRSTDRLPSAHTCFNQLDLPVYETYDKLRTYLLKAIHECSEGFGFA